MDDETAPDAPEHYTLLRELGRGGCGVVYLARDDRLDRNVALKFLTDARPSDIERMRREARFAAKLDDPAIVRVYELGEAGGEPFIAMQYVEGGDLGSATLPWREVVKAARTVAGALSRAHAAGIVHRDVKPENILRDRSGRVFLTDFGIARDLDRAGTSTLSVEGAVIGTPGLMAPEQARGNLMAVDGRSDVYALGATLYQLLTGRPPFTGENVVEVLVGVMHEEPPRLRRARPDLPEELDDIVQRCLSKMREARYQSMDAMGHDLDRVLTGARVAPAQGSLLRRIAASRMPPKPEQPDERGWRTAAEAAREIAAWDADLFRISRDLPRTYDRLRRVIGKMDDRLADRPDLAWARFYRGMAKRRLGEFAAAVEDIERSIDRVPDPAGAHFELGSVHLDLYLREHRHARHHVARSGGRAHLLDHRGHLESALAAFRQTESLGGDLPTWKMHFAHAAQKIAEDDAEGCVAACDRLLAEDPDLAEVWKLKGDAEHFAGRDPAESYERAAEVRRSFFEARFAQAQACLERGELEAAGSAISRTLSIHPEFVPALALRCQLLLAEVRAGKGDDSTLASAIESADRCIENAPGHYLATITRAELAIEAGDRGEFAAYETALSLVSRARNLEGCQDRVSLVLAGALLGRARRAAQVGNADEARRDLDRILAMQTKQPPGHGDNTPWGAVYAEATALLDREG